MALRAVLQARFAHRRTGCVKVVHRAIAVVVHAVALLVDLEHHLHASQGGVDTLHLPGGTWTQLVIKGTGGAP